ncbi:MAG: Extracellular solute-binding protein family 1 [Candidatus Woesebacteria bacterium GW2011_GWB1_38_5]|uniref:Extracellular solute-binding protein family 1 n=3 Tax=Candidatus Woeseibacteriota TaxID=1752722 RepID=A0A0G0K4T8_9BACT|nr:MAG: Extracellular solute-binding protein family 1 [Candidatus Woesebacteria bacterium GW2011_GWD1_38_10]KKQ74728.1 MAG: Extracellular solute-binding protein family 1 [Candidatus Woesebacteria bacterium GW2011_GWB1_38_5]KKQ84654.1 MAG: Extracellular solute-binding protein family 1 [Candidatus Woesebacteria bacterium GW2011_GWA1_38_8]
MANPNINNTVYPLADSQKPVEKDSTPVNLPANIKPKRTDQFVQYPKPSEIKPEEFVYKKKTGFNSKKAMKTFMSILSLAIISVPLVFFFMKYNPFSKDKTVQKGEVVWWNLGGNETVLNEMIGEYSKKNPEAKIKLIVQSETDYRERLTNSLKDNRGPDIFTIHNSWMPMFLEYLDVVPESIYTLEEYSRIFYSVVSKDMRTSEGVVGIPLEYDALTLFINEEMFSFSGKSAPATWDEFKVIAKDLTIRGANNFILQSGAAMGSTDNVDYWPEILATLMLQNKSNLDSPTGTGSYEAMVVFVEYNKTDKVWDTTLPDSTTAFAEGKVAMFFAPSRVAGEINKLNPNLKYRTIELPQVRRDDPNEPKVSYSTYFVQSVWKKSGDKDLAWDFLKFLSSKESLEKINQNLTGIGDQKKAYPRIEMRDLLINDRVLGSVVALAPISTSWYLADKTNDGVDGINTKINEEYKKTINSIQIGKRGAATENDPLLKALTTSLRKILSSYNI